MTMYNYAVSRRFFFIRNLASDFNRMACCRHEFRLSLFRGYECLHRAKRQNMIAAMVWKTDKDCTVNRVFIVSVLMFDFNFQSRIWCQTVRTDFSRLTVCHMSFFRTDAGILPCIFPRVYIRFSAKPERQSVWLELYIRIEHNCGLGITTLSTFIFVQPMMIML